MFLKYCFPILLLLMSSPFLHIRAQKYRVFHVNFQDPLLIFLVISKCQE